ncbi:rod shape-determining protein MreC [bacterium (Candidatus Gribaldobacteria) CG07_land_8_20_14_0_80_33_18]|uniref:Cell shape-determining protein MreC n=1 Tax=bacterium (Candidatus Gribaldobacteria) CG07_land_8_20_14_0_80_33_18 TaxID=2014272 RepID=A0A2M6Z464_9BACT|nr:MAG: rod shape-determining protein MreC [bacterium (Candidatus Gribaldobacteria) CG10_big_fil_rev_8_21_14_0_10_33_41]PIU47208.1 MAG: rod shape-determining protein MreC [bacterium (Candidatus Gribaldobacteria) CG07_land_8_20_14_0_80_33_18]PJA00968.1 MAG: rod shape-determining protein MreC [bacterium (Candidatus Gribaldobacteria) CG_4_10_14_0_2_um_filter_33_15]PJB08586.1 MAG: rod shape-determining protein MreC [bacterium (Candidatus Gribaldobacteria) CG_4_9_14_3_um_filter_33_9]
MKLKRGKFLLIIILIILILISFNKFLLREIKNAFYTISLPFFKNFSLTGDKISSFFQTFSEFKNLKTENQKLLEQNQNLLAKIVEFELLKKENEELRKALNLGLEKEFQLILVKSISKETEGDFILISKGKEDGMIEGLPVISAEKVLVGKIDQVYKNFSRVKLISAENNIFDVEIITAADSREKIYGLAQGEGNFKIKIKFIPKEKEIKEGETVISSNIAQKFPQGFLVGEIKKVEKSDIEPHQIIELEPFFKLNLGQTLFVILNF